MELSRVINFVDAEAEMHNRVVVYEEQFQARALAEARVAVASHEAALAEHFAEDRARAQTE
eukprot:1902637-Pyramimonas_sp.AAC.1